MLSRLASQPLPVKAALVHVPLTFLAAWAVAYSTVGSIISATMVASTSAATAIVFTEFWMRVRHPGWFRDYRPGRH